MEAGDDFLSSTVQFPLISSWGIWRFTVAFMICFNSDSTLLMIIKSRFSLLSPKSPHSASRQICSPIIALNNDRKLPTKCPSASEGREKKNTCSASVSRGLCRHQRHFFLDCSKGGRTRARAQGCLTLRKQSCLTFPWGWRGD